MLVDTGETVGRIYARTSAGMAQPDWCGDYTLNARQPFYGVVKSKRAFAVRWRA